jgi:hypothetical protein
MMPPTPLVSLFSPNPNETHSGRTTPSSVGEATSSRFTIATVNSSRAISFDMQPDLANGTIQLLIKDHLKTGVHTEKDR